MPGRFIAMLPLEEPTVIGLDDMVAGLKDRVPQLGSEIVGRPYTGDKAAASEAYIVSISGCHFAIAYVGQPASAGTFDTAIAHAAAIWPDAADSICNHSGHIIISNLIAAKSFDAAVDAAGSVSLIAGILNELTPSLGVYWANAEVLMARERFAATTDLLIGGQPPVEAWINIQAHRDGRHSADGTPMVSVSTLGLDSFCGREIESSASAVGESRARDRVLAVAADILRNGPELADNSVIRIGENDTITVTLAGKGQFHDGPIILLTATEPEADNAGVEHQLSHDNADVPAFAGRKRAKKFAG